MIGVLKVIDVRKYNLFQIEEQIPLFFFVFKLLGTCITDITFLYFKPVY